MEQSKLGKKIHPDVIKGSNACLVIQGCTDFVLDIFKLQLHFLLEQKLFVKKTVLFSQNPPQPFLANGGFGQLSKFV